MKTRFGVALAMAALLSVGTAGCAFITPQATTKEVETANGVNGRVGTIDIRNATLISDDNGELASMIVSFYNSDPAARDLTIQYRSDGSKTDTSVQIAGSGTTSFGAKGETQIVLSNIDGNAGSLFPVYFQYGDTEGKQLLLPVLTTEFSEYTGLAPTPLPTPTATPTPVLAPTPAATTPAE